MKKNPQITLIGYAGTEEYPTCTYISKYCYLCAEQIGEFIGKNGWYLITGGETGVMEASSKGCKKFGGTTIGVMTGQKRFSSNSYIDIEVITNSYVTGSTPTLISMADVVIVCGGGAGTLQEITIAYRLNKPIIVVKNTGGWADKLSDPYLDERNKYPILQALNVADCISLCTKVISINFKETK